MKTAIGIAVLLIFVVAICVFAYKVGKIIEEIENERDEPNEQP